MSPGVSPGDTPALSAVANLAGSPSRIVRRLTELARTARSSLIRAWRNSPSTGFASSSRSGAGDPPREASDQMSVLIQTALTSRYSSSECMLISFPQPLIFEPPKGMAGSKLPYVFTHTMPVFIEWAT